MPRIDHRTNDPVLNLYMRVRELENLIKRSRKPVRVQLQSGSNTGFTLSEGDGSIWIDVDDGSLHWVANGVERKVSGTIV
jgi:hypothetical protein